jgi:exodeoxyribonuclease VII small subunit
MHPMSPQPAKPSFDDGLDRLEALVQQLESGSLSLEEALARFEEGVQLSQALQQHLAEAQRKVEVLKAGLGGEYRAEPLADRSPEGGKDTL